MNGFAVAIINYNLHDVLRLCLRTVVANAPDEIVVVDNASVDGSAAMVRTEFPGVRVIENAVNRGYGAASNQAVAACRSSYILLINNDILLAPGTLDSLSEYLDANPRAAIAGPRLRNLDGTFQPSCFPFPSPLDIFLDTTNLVRRTPYLRQRALRTWVHDRERSVPWISGAALAIRRSAFEQVGGFDDDFFMYYEEVDLCYRLRQAGWEIWFTPRVDTAHIGGASARQRPAQMLVQFYASLDLFYQKHYNRLQRFELAALLRAIALARLVRDSLRLRSLSDASERERLSAGCKAWRHLLLGKGPEEVGVE